MVIARVESLILGKSLNDALKRAKAYVKAGADGIMIHSKKKHQKKYLISLKNLENLSVMFHLFAFLQVIIMLKKLNLKKKVLILSFMQIICLELRILRW